MKKRILSALLAFVMVLTLLPTALAVSPFGDVKEDDWFYDAVVYVHDKGLMIGTDKGFEPYAKTVRASIWAILARIDGVNTTVKDGVWYAIAQEWSILMGVSDGSAPGENITREQLVVMFYRYAEQKGYDVSVGEDGAILNYSDAQSVSEFALEAMKWACAVGLLKGSDGKLNPKGTATRAEVAEMLYRFCRLMDSMKQSFTVTFDYNYNNLGTYTTVTVERGKAAAQPVNPARAGYVFAGWYTAPTGGTRYDFTAAVTGDLTLYARWGLVSVNPTNPNPTPSQDPSPVPSYDPTPNPSENPTHTHEYGQWTTNWKEAAEESGFQSLKSTRSCACNGEDGTQTSTDTFYIYTVDDVKNFDKLVEQGNQFEGKTVKLMNNLDFAAGSANEDAPAMASAGLEEFVPSSGNDFNGIGANSYEEYPGYAFGGTFDGQSHTISNVSVESEIGNYACAGFFNSIDPKAVVKNLKLDKANITSTHYAGAVAGFAAKLVNDSATIENCQVTNSKVVSKTHNKSGSWDDGDKVGGIIGYTAGTVKDCFVEKTEIQGYRDLGGIVGYAMATATVTGNSIENVTITIDSTHNYNNYAAFADYDANSIMGEVENGCERHDNSGEASISLSVADGISRNASGEYEISKAAGLTWFAEKLRQESGSGSAADHTLEGATITLTADIDMTDVEWTIMKYGGSSEKRLDKVTINGNGKTITGLKAPLLDGMENSDLTIKDLTIKNADVTMPSDDNNTTGAGILVARAYKLSVENCVVTDSKIDGGSSHTGTGVLVGYVPNGGNSVTISGCAVRNCTITNAKHAGGILGFCMTSSGVTRTISNCNVENCAITSIKTDAGDVWCIGYIVGTVNTSGKLTLNNCSATGGSLTQGSKTKPEGQSNLYGWLTGTAALEIDGVTITA